MSRVVLSGGAYQSRSVIAGAQRCVNLYPESNPAESDPPVPVTHYPTPGLRQLGTTENISVFRGLYTASNGELYAVIGTLVYVVSNAWTYTLLGTVADRRTPVSMADNGTTLLIVDGTSTGYTVDLGSQAFGTVVDAAFYGADRVEYLDTYFILNRPGTGEFYISGSLALTFDPLDIARKQGGADNIATILAVRGELVVIGDYTSEVFVNTGAADFTFERQPGASISHGCAAKYSAAKQDVSGFWLSQDKEGNGIVVRYSGYAVERISTHAIEAAIQGYSRIDDAIGYCYQQQGHAFYVLTFPSADVTWAYELKTKQWHELAWTDANGVLHRHRANCCAFAYGQNVVGDWQNGALYALDPNVFDDAGQPIVRIRTFPHLLSDGKRVSYSKFIADMEVGTLASGGEPGSDFGLDFGPDFGPLPDAYTPRISLRYSDTRGATYGEPRIKSMGRAGEYDTSIAWWRLGMARDRVFELSWSAPIRTALNGAFVEAEKHRT
jgi:hypothetical protein